MVTPTRLLKLSLFLGACLAMPARAGDFEDLVAAERAFAADAHARGAQAAFLAALADDGLVIAPGPTSGRRVWETRTNFKGKLEWAPALAEVAASGDLGYTSGPWRYTPEDGDKPTAFGHFLTVWSKQADGQWKVLLDHGIGHGEQAFPEKVVRRGALTAVAPPVWPVGVAELRKADLLPAGALSASVVAADFLRLRDGLPPDSNIDGMTLAMAASGRTDCGWVISGAGDLAATWGGGANAPSWVRIWRRPVAGDPPGLGWRLAVDMSQSAPLPKPAE